MPVEDMMWWYWLPWIAMTRAAAVQILAGCDLAEAALGPRLGPARSGSVVAFPAANVILFPNSALKSTLTFAAHRRRE